MKYIAIFDIPDDYNIGCASAKIAVNGKDIYKAEDFENAYADVEPLSEEKAEVFERFKIVNRVIYDLGLSNAYDMPGFWCDKGKSYKVIPTKYHKGYMQALKDVEVEIRKHFGFAERGDIITMPNPFNTEVD